MYEPLNMTGRKYSSTDGRALLTLDHNLLVTGRNSDLARILAALPTYIPAAHRQPIAPGFL
jgi:hypothetical protein